MHITHTHITEKRTDWIGTVRRGSSLCLYIRAPISVCFGNTLIFEYGATCNTGPHAY